jgi:hypothetical protein
MVSCLSVFPGASGARRGEVDMVGWSVRMKGRVRGGRCGRGRSEINPADWISEHW